MTIKDPTTPQTRYYTTLQILLLRDWDPRPRVPLLSKTQSYYLRDLVETSHASTQAVPRILKRIDGRSR